MTDTPPPSPTTAEGDPAWLNPATIKGAILVGLGMLFLLFPTASTPLLRYGFGVALIFFGAVSVWLCSLPATSSSTVSGRRCVSGRGCGAHHDRLRRRGPHRRRSRFFSKEDGLDSSEPATTP